MATKKKTAVTLSPRRNGLSKAARELLARVKVAASPEVIFGLEPAIAAAKVQSVVGPMIRVMLIVSASASTSSENRGPKTEDRTPPSARSS
jgi:hypothetical protein